MFSRDGSRPPSSYADARNIDAVIVSQEADSAAATAATAGAAATPASLTNTEQKKVVKWEVRDNSAPPSSFRVPPEFSLPPSLPSPSSLLFLSLSLSLSLVLCNKYRSFLDAGVLTCAHC